MKTFQRKVLFNPGIFGPTFIFILIIIACMAFAFPFMALLEYGNYINGNGSGGLLGLICVILVLFILICLNGFLFFREYFNIENHKKFVTNLHDTVGHTFTVKDFKIGFTKKFPTLVTLRASSESGFSRSMKRSHDFKYLDRFVFTLIAEDGKEYFVDYDMFTEVFIGNKVTVKSVPIDGIEYVKYLEIVDGSMEGDKNDQTARKEELFNSKVR